VLLILAALATFSGLSANAGLPATTVISHGFTTGDKGIWVQAMAEAVVARAGEGSIYRYTGATGAWTFVSGDGSSDVLALIFNWVPESDAPDIGPNLNYVQAAGDALQAMLRDAKYVGGSGPADLVTGRAVHLLGHSRGACVMSEAARRLGAAGIDIDQVTLLDPHPVNGTLDTPYNFNWGDPVPQAWSTVAFTDNYWRADGGGLINGLDFDGIPITNAFNTQLSESALNCCAYSFAHLDVHLWLHGTIDLAAAPCDGEQCINATMRSTWWPQGFTQRGYYYSVIGGGSALRPILPLGPPPGVMPIIENGDFAQGTYAGWSFHGGTVGAAAGSQITLDGSNGYLRLGPTIGTGATHNRFFLPDEAATVRFDERVFAAGAGQSLEIILNEVGGASHSVGTRSLDAVSAWTPGVEMVIPSSVPRGRLFTITTRVNASAGGGGGGTAIAGIDNLDIVLGLPPVPCPADIAPIGPVGGTPGDGVVNVDDLLAVINAWGACGNPNDCPADIAPPGRPTGNDVVNVDDLLTVINAWGPCP